MTETPRYWRDILSERDPAALDLVTAQLKHAGSAELSGIPSKFRELMALSASTALREPASIRTHMDRAIAAGADDTMLLHAILVGGLSGGVPALAAGLSVLDQARPTAEPESAHTEETTNENHT